MADREQTLAVRACAQTTPHEPHIYRPVGKAMPEGEFRCTGAKDVCVDPGSIYTGSPGAQRARRRLGF